MLANVYVAMVTVGVVVFMVRLSWRLTMVTLIGLPLIMGVSKLYGQYIEVSQHLLSNNSAALLCLDPLKVVAGGIMRLVCACVR